MKREEPILNIQGSIIYNKRPSSSNVTKTKQTIVNAIQSLPIKEQQIPFKSNIVQIKVKNDKNQEKLFYCNHEILVREIKFFSDLNSNEIQVNCDLNVFAYLMEFVNTRMIKIPNPQASISILVSAKFLLMETLVLVCLDYIANQISAVSMLDIDMVHSCNLVLH